MARPQLPPNQPESSSDGRDERTVFRTNDAESLLDLLGDEYTQRVLAAIGDDTVTGSELRDRAGVSKATAYRRLDDLQEAGIVESTMQIDRELHHCEQYQLAVAELAISFRPEGFTVTVEYDEPETLDDEKSRQLVPADD